MTIAATRRNEIDSWNRGHPDCRLSIVGEITSSGYFLHDGKRLIDLDNAQGYQHFD
jgi:hypothetical protein